MTDKKQIPEFKSPEEERAFWDSTDATDLEPDSIEDAREFAPGPRPPMTTFALRIEAKDIDRARVIAEGREVGVSQLMREWILEGIDRAEANPDSEAVIEAVRLHAEEIAGFLVDVVTKQQTTADLMEALKKSVAEARAESERETA